jgi:hypothetical protein
MPESEAEAAAGDSAARAEPPPEWVSALSAQSCTPSAIDAATTESFRQLMEISVQSIQFAHQARAEKFSAAEFMQ